MVKQIQKLAPGWRSGWSMCGALCSVALLLCLPAQAAEVSAQLDRNHIVEGETVTLVVETNDPQQSLDGDFSMLDADFELLDQRSETQMSIVNGRQSAIVRLILTLEPRHSGVITVPALHFGTGTTAPLPLTVDPAPAPEPGEAPPVFIEVGVEPENGPWYVHAQVLLTVRVFYQLSLTEAAISQPEPVSASVRLLDEVPFQADRHGQRYKVLERHYAVFPERSGPLVIPPMKLSGRVVERRSDKLWQPASRGRRIEVESDPQELLIQPKPASFGGKDWLPARALQLTQTVSAGDSLTVGEPVTRTIIVDAMGLEENMITEPVWPPIADARIYPDQPQGISRNDGKWVLGHKEFRYAIVPEKAGELVLPELILHWWDTANDREQTAILPEEKFNVLPSAAIPAPPPVVEAPAVAVPAGVAPGVAAGERSGPGFWPWVTLLFAALWLATTGAYVWRQRSGRKPAANRIEWSADESEVLLRLQQACDVGDAAKARQALLRWLREFGPREAGGSLIEFATRQSPADLREQLFALDAAGYRPGHELTWSGKALWKNFSDWRKSWAGERRRQQPDPVDLYPRTSGR